MRVSCPNCAAAVESDPGELAACSACGHWWIAEAPAPAEAPGEPEPAEALAADATADATAEPSPAPAPLVSETPLPPRVRGPINELPSPAPTPEEHPWEFELQLGVGDRVEGPFDRMYLREHVYMGRLTGDERLRVPGAKEWERLGDRPEFAEVLHLLGKDGPVLGNKRIAGWQKAGPGDATLTGSAPRPSPAESAPRAPHSVPATGGPAAPSSGSAGSKGPMLAVAIIALVAVLAAVAGLVLTR